jgi:hypothetical protein
MKKNILVTENVIREQGKIFKRKWSNCIAFYKVNIILELIGIVRMITIKIFVAVTLFNY